MSNPTLIVTSILVVVLGAVGLIQGPKWLACMLIMIGIVGLIIGLLDRKKS